jgi:peptide-methionine (S)-S-oxide reductase
MTETNKPMSFDLRSRSSSLSTFITASFALAALIAVFTLLPAHSSETATVIPAPTLDEPTSGVDSETAVFAGGCFWGIQGVFEHVNGVTKAVSGYTGGDAATARYEDVGLGSTGHAESVQVSFDPKQVSFGQLLQIYFSVAHDPTQLNRQGPDRGTQYRSAIFPTSATQTKIARDYIAQLNDAHAYPSTIVTGIEPGKTFYPAEAYHQDFLEHNRGYGYIIANDLPKIANLERVFPDRYRRDAVMVTPYPR